MPSPTPTRRRRRRPPIISRRPCCLVVTPLLLLLTTTSATSEQNTNATQPQQQHHQQLLGSLLGPVPGAGPFFADFWQRKPAVIQRRNPTFYHPVLRSAELDTILALGQADCRLVKRVRGRDGEWWSSSPPAPDAAADGDGNDDDLVAAAVRRVERAHAAFRRGFSLVVDRLDEKHDAVGRLAAAVEAEIGHRVGANLYWTPGEGAQAFEAHFDWMVRASWVVR